MCTPVAGDDPDVRSAGAEPVRQQNRARPRRDLLQCRGAGPGRRRQAVAFAQHAAAARLRHFERALDAPLIDERIDVRLVELDQTRQEAQLVVGLEQLRPRLLDRVERRFEMARRLVGLRPWRRRRRRARRAPSSARSDPLRRRPAPRRTGAPLRPAVRALARSARRSACCERGCRYGSPLRSVLASSLKRAASSHSPRSMFAAARFPAHSAASAWRFDSFATVSA